MASILLKQGPEADARASVSACDRWVPYRVVASPNIQQCRHMGVVYRPLVSPEERRANPRHAGRGCGLQLHLAFSLLASGLLWANRRRRRLCGGDKLMGRS